MLRNYRSKLLVLTNNGRITFKLDKLPDGGHAR